MLLNQRGKLFLSFAHKFAQVDEECRQMFQMDQPGAQRTLNVGTIPLMAAYGILDLVSDFQKKHPNIVLHLENPGICQPVC